MLCANDMSMNSVMQLHVKEFVEVVILQTMQNCNDDCKNMYCKTYNTLCPINRLYMRDKSAPNMHCKPLLYLWLQER